MKGSEGKTPDQSKPGGGTATGKKSAIKILKSIISDEQSHFHAHRVVDQVFWESLDIGYEVIFDTPPHPDDNDPWPFNEKADKDSATIVVPAKGVSRKFTVRASAKKKDGRIGYGYKLDPPHPTRPSPEIVPDP